MTKNLRSCFSLFCFHTVFFIRFFFCFSCVVYLLQINNRFSSFADRQKLFHHKTPFYYIAYSLPPISFLVLIFLLLFPYTLYFIHYFFSYVHLSSLFFCCLLSSLIEDLIRKTSLLQHYQRKQSKHEHEHKQTAGDRE